MIQAMRIDHIPSEEGIRNFYNECAALGPMQPGMYRSRHQRRRLQRIKDLLTLLPAFTPNVLEMGCCEGMLSQWLAPRVDYLLAFDVAAPCIARARELDLPTALFVVGTLEELIAGKPPIPTLLSAYEHAVKFDLAIASSVLEHCPDPEATLDQLRSVSWAILATVPIREKPNPNAFSVAAYKDPKQAADGTGHIWYFRPDTFKALFREIWHYEEVDGMSAILLGR